MKFPIWTGSAWELKRKPSKSKRGPVRSSGMYLYISRDDEPLGIAIESKLRDLPTINSEFR